MSDEPDIIINGVRLNTAQAMTVRVALTSFGLEMNEPDALGDDEHGRAMSKLYRERAAEVVRLMLAARKTEGER
jgi:hypothetical protein